MEERRGEEFLEKGEGGFVFGGRGQEREEGKKKKREEKEEIGKINLEDWIMNRRLKNKIQNKKQKSLFLFFGHVNSVFFFFLVFYVCLFFLALSTFSRSHKPPPPFIVANILLGHSRIFQTSAISLNRRIVDRVAAAAGVLFCGKISVSSLIFLLVL